PGEERSHALVRARPAEHLRGNLPRVRIDPHHQGALLFQDRGEQPVREVEASVLRAHPATSSSSSKQGPHSRRPTAIPFTRPYKRSPASGVFLAFERQREGSTEPDSPGAKSVRSHGAPSAIRASPSPAIRRGRAESASIRAAHETLPVATSRLYSAGSATSSPAAPKGATSNSASFSSGVQGVWSVTMQSTVPSRTPSSRASPSARGRSGGISFLRVS